MLLDRRRRAESLYGGFQTPYRRAGIECDKAALAFKDIFGCCDARFGHGGGEDAVLRCKTGMDRLCHGAKLPF